MITFADARRIVEEDVPGGAETADYGYESDGRWFPLVLPERIGGRVPGVSKASGVLTWMSSLAPEYSESRPWVAGAAGPRASVVPGVAAALATLRRLRRRLTGDLRTELDAIIAELAAADGPKGLRNHPGHADQKSHGRRRTGALGSVLDKLDALRDKLGDDDRSLLDTAMRQLQGLESSDVDDDDLIDDEPEEDGEDADDEADEDEDELVMESASGELTFTPYLDGEIDVDWDDGGFRFTPTSAREVADAVERFSSLPIAEGPPDAPEPPAWVVDQKTYQQWYKQWRDEWDASPAGLAHNGAAGEMVTADGELKVVRYGSGVTWIGDPETVDADELSNVIQLDDNEEAAAFAEMMRRALAVSTAPVVGNGLLVRVAAHRAGVRCVGSLLAAVAWTRNRFDPSQARDDDGKWTDGAPSEAFQRLVQYRREKDPLIVQTKVGGADFVGSARVGDDDSFGVNMYAEVDEGGNRYLVVENGTAGDVVAWGSSSSGTDESAILADEQIAQLRTVLPEAIGAAEAGHPFERVISGEDNGDLRVTAADGRVQVAAYSWTTAGRERDDAIRIAEERGEVNRRIRKAKKDHAAGRLDPFEDGYEFQLATGRYPAREDFASDAEFERYWRDEQGFDSLAEYETFATEPIDPFEDVSEPTKFDPIPAADLTVTQARELMVAVERLTFDPPYRDLPKNHARRLLARQYKRDRSGRFADTDAGGLLSQVDDLIGQLEGMQPKLSRAERDAIDDVLDGLREVRETRRRAAAGEAVHRDKLDMDVAGYDRPITVDLDTTYSQEITVGYGADEFWFHADLVAGVVAAVDELVDADGPGERLLDDGELRVARDSDGVIEVGPVDDGIAPLRLQPGDGYADAKAFADALEELAATAQTAKVENRARRILAALNTAPLRNHPGHPDQKTHGRRGGLADPSKLLGDLLAIPFAPSVEGEIGDSVRAAYSGKFAGFTVDSVSVRVRDGSAGIVGLVRDSDGNTVGTVMRTLDLQDDGTVWAGHRYMQLDENLRGQGFAEAYNAHLIDWYRDNGVSAVELKAASSVGGYAQARGGYDWRDSKAAEGVFDRVRDAADPSRPRYGLQPAGDNMARVPVERLPEQRRLAQEMVARFEGTQFGSDDYPTPFEVSQLGRWPGAGKDDMWAGKAIMLGSSWDGVRQL